MTTSKHYMKDRQWRENLINEIGEGEVIYSTLYYDERRKKEFRYQITENAIIKIIDPQKNHMITKVIATPSNLKKYWSSCPQYIINKAVKYKKLENKMKKEYKKGLTK